MGKVSITKRKLKGGIESLNLYYRFNGQRVREKLNLYLYPKGHLLHKDNKVTLELAESAKNKIQHEMFAGKFTVIATHKKKFNFIEYLNLYAESYTKKDYRKFFAIAKAFRTFAGSDNLPCSAVSPYLVEKFLEHLNTNYKGSTPSGYFKCIRKVLKSATKEGLFISNPADGIINNKPSRNELTKEVLMDHEIVKLYRTPCPNEEVKRAFLFSTQTGMAPVDIRKLKWKDVQGDHIRNNLQRSKTNVVHTVLLNSNAKRLLGKKGKPEELVFNLPSWQDSINKTLQSWVKRAKINKHITFYCGRHSFATNLLIHGIDLKTTSRSLGQASTKHTEKYTHISEAMKKKAVNLLPKF